VSDFEVLGRKFGEEGTEDKDKEGAEEEEEKKANAADVFMAKLSTPERKSEVRRDKQGRALSSAKHLLTTSADWRYSNKLDPYYGDHFHPNETAIDSLMRASRKEVRSGDDRSDGLLRRVYEVSTSV
jgi:hypothetical protein